MGKRKPGLTVEQHVRCAGQMRNARFALLEVVEMVGGGYAKRHNANRALARLWRIVGEIRLSLSAEVLTETRGRDPRGQGIAVYYGGLESIPGTFDEHDAFDGYCEQSR